MEIFSGIVLQKIFVAVIVFINFLFAPSTNVDAQAQEGEPSIKVVTEAELKQEPQNATHNKGETLNRKNLPQQKKVEALEEATSIEKSNEEPVELVQRDIFQVANTDIAVASGGVMEDTEDTTPAETGDLYNVIAVVDGDTIKVAMGGSLETLRIIGINTPETVDPRRTVECYGKEASNKAKEMLLGKKVVLEADSSQQDRDKYGRLLRYVFVDGVDYGKEMIAKGYAHEYTYNIPYNYQRDYKQSERLAQENQIGLWSPTVCKADNSISQNIKIEIPATNSAGLYYTSSNVQAKNYYPSSCEAWKNLSKTYLQSFESIDELLAHYPGRTLSKRCG